MHSSQAFCVYLTPHIFFSNRFVCRGFHGLAKGPCPLDRSVRAAGVGRWGPTGTAERRAAPRLRLAWQRRAQAAAGEQPAPQGVRRPARQPSTRPSASVRRQSGDGTRDATSDESLVESRVWLWPPLLAQFPVGSSPAASMRNAIGFRVTVSRCDAKTLNCTIDRQFGRSKVAARSIACSIEFRDECVFFQNQPYTDRNR